MSNDLDGTIENINPSWSEVFFVMFMLLFWLPLMKLVMKLRVIADTLAGPEDSE